MHALPTGASLMRGMLIGLGPVDAVSSVAPPPTGGHVPRDFPSTRSRFQMRDASPDAVASTFESWSTVSTPIEVECRSTDTALVTLRGEHDLGSRAQVIAALARASMRPSVIVDLSPCTFADSSVLSAIASAANRLSASGGRIGLVVAPHSVAVRRAIEVMGIDQMIPVHACRDDALQHASSTPDGSRGELRSSP
jgi:anti-anti-sigma factor